MGDPHILNQGSDSPNDADIERISSYYFELERLLQRVGDSETHYNVLGVEKNASADEIGKAYRVAVGILKPDGVAADAMPDGLLERVDDAFDRVSTAFSLLTNVARRRDYNRRLAARSNPLADEELLHEPTGTSRHPGGNRRAAGNDRRRARRLKLLLPVTVTGYDRRTGRWQEETYTVDVSRTGIALRLKKRLAYGGILHLRLPLPAALRSHGRTEEMFEVYALVRRIEPAREGVRVVGFEFLGERPPLGFLNRPWAPFRTLWTGPDRRRETRVTHSQMVVVEFLDESLNPIRQEPAVLENVSRGGARVYVRQTPPECEMVRVVTLTCDFESMAVVCNRYVDRDGLERVCVRFIDRQWPL